jgi:hypothetical protein
LFQKCSKKYVSWRLQRSLLIVLFLSFHYFHVILICMYDVIYEAEIALCNINKLPLQLKKVWRLAQPRKLIFCIFPLWVDLKCILPHIILHELFFRAYYIIYIFRWFVTGLENTQVLLKKPAGRLIVGFFTVAFQAKQIF